MTFGHAALAVVALVALVALVLFVRRALRYAQKPSRSIATLRREEIAARLQTLAETPIPPDFRPMVAMCYDVAARPTRAEYTCPACGEKTLYWRRFVFKRYLPSVCNSCVERTRCDGGCREASHVVYGQPDAPDPLLMGRDVAPPPRHECCLNRG